MENALEKIGSLVDEAIKDTDLFVVKLAIKPTNNIKLYLDASSAFTVERMVQLNRHLRNAIEDIQLYPDGDFSLEVSSPGIDEPLIDIRQYQKNIGRDIEFKLKDQEAPIIARLDAITDEALSVMVKGIKGRPGKPLVIQMDSIEKAVVQISFK